MPTPDQSPSLQGAKLVIFAMFSLAGCSWLVADTIEVIAFAGQSNSIGIRRNSEYALGFKNYPEIVIHGPRQLNGAYRESVTASVRAGQPFGGEWSFAEKLGTTGYRNGLYVFLNSGSGGIPASQWNPQSRRHPQIWLFANSFGILKAKIEKDFPQHRVALGAVVFQQGERDAATSLTDSHWKSHVQQFARWVRSNYGQNIPFFFPSLTTMQESGYMPEGVRNVRRQQLEITQPDDPYYVSDSHYIELNPIAGHVGDNQHYSAPAYDEIGLRIFEAFATVKSIPAALSLPTSAFGIDRLEKAADGSIHIGWPAKHGRKYIVEFGDTLGRFFPLGSPVHAFGTRASITDLPGTKIPRRSPSRFYEVRKQNAETGSFSRVRVKRIEATPNEVVLEWASEIDGMYIVTYSDGLGDRFQTLSEPIRATGPMTEFADPGYESSSNGRVRYYRVRELATD